MKKILFFFFVLFLSSVAALDCSAIANQQWCEDIQNSSLSEAEKEYLLSDIISNSKHYPDHQLVKQWNQKVSTTTPPEGITKKNSEYIKNAWVKILAVMPSVLFNGTLYLSNNGEALLGYNHDVQIPSGTAAGDCQTKRDIIRNVGTAQFFINNHYQGSGHSVPYAASWPHNADITLKAVYTAEVTAKVKHYTWQKDYYGKNGRKRYKWVCDYERTEYQRDTLTISDTLRAKIHNPQPMASFTVKDQYLDTVKGEFISKDAVNAELTFFDSYYKEHNYVFSEVVSLKPVQVLTIKAEKQLSQEHRNLAYSGSEITVPIGEGCQIAVYDFFAKKVLPCDLAYESPEFTVTTDQKVYGPNDTITVIIEPSGKEYLVAYAGKEYQTTGALPLQAVYPYNTIEVRYKDRVVPKLIHVKNDKPLHTAFSLVIFGLGNYVLVGFIRKYWGVVLG